MNASDVRLLLVYNRWANEQMLADVRPLSEDELTRDMQTSFRSILGTVAHIFWTEYVWVRRWRRESPQQAPDYDRYKTLADVETPWRDVQAAQERFAADVTDEQLQERIAYVNYLNEHWEYALGHMIQHLINHSTYHRGQIVTLLRQLGREAHGTDFVQFLDEGQ